MQTNLLHALQVVTQLRVELIGDDLRVLSVLVVLLIVEEPGGDVELQRVRNDCLERFDLLLGELACALVQVDVGLLADQVAESSADAANLCQRIHHLVGALHVRIQNTKNQLEIGILAHESLNTAAAQHSTLRCVAIQHRSQQQIHSSDAAVEATVSG